MRGMCKTNVSEHTVTRTLLPYLYVLENAGENAGEKAMRGHIPRMAFSPALANTQ